jgi:hypothetical protein
MGTASEEQEQSETMLRWDLGEELVIYYGQHDGSELSEVQIEAKLEVQAKTKKTGTRGDVRPFFAGGHALGAVFNQLVTWCAVARSCSS